MTVIRWLHLTRLRPYLAAQSRTARDTLFLLGVLAWTLLPHAGHIPSWCTAMAAIALVWRVHLTLTAQRLPPRWVLLAAMALACALTWKSTGAVTSKDTGVTLLVVLSTLKTLEMRVRRDTLVIAFLGFVLVLTNFLYSQSPWVALGMLGSVTGLFTALLLAHLPDVPDQALAHRQGSAPHTRRPPGLRLAARLTARHMLLGAPLVALLFMLFPRLPPLWGVASDGVAHTGLSDRMSLGQVAELAGDDTLAMRVRFLGSPPPKDQLYFRGPVLTRYDGRDWRALPDFGIEKNLHTSATATGTQADATIAYEMTVEPLRVATLPLLETTLEPPIVSGSDLRLTLRDDLHWQPDRLITDRLQVQARASVRPRHPDDPLPPLHEEQIQLPIGAHPRTRAWALGWHQSLLRRQNLSMGTALYSTHVVQALLNYIHQNDYAYTLTPGKDSPAADAVDAFWLDRRSGFCEHYAATTVVILRSLGIPARIVTGYLGGEINSVDGLLDIRQSDAHAWVEYWRPGEGWTRADPTGAVAPERILQSQRPRHAQGLIGSTLSSMSPNLVVQWQSWRELWTAIDQRWNDHLLNYNARQQHHWLERLGLDHPDATTLMRLLGGSLGAGGLLAAGWASWQARARRRGDPWLQEWRSIQAVLNAQGWPIEGHEGPQAAIARLAQARARRTDAMAAGSSLRPADVIRLQTVLADFERWRYADRSAGTPQPQTSRTRQLRRQAQIARTLLVGKDIVKK